MCHTQKCTWSYLRALFLKKWFTWTALSKRVFFFLFIAERQRILILMHKRPSFIKEMHTWAWQLATENFCGKDTAEYTLIQTFWYWLWKFSNRFCELNVCVNHTESDLPSGVSLKVFYKWVRCWVWKQTLVPHCQDAQNPCEADGANRLGSGGHRYQCWTAPAPAKNAYYSLEMG